MAIPEIENSILSEARIIHTRFFPKSLSTSGHIATTSMNRRVTNYYASLDLEPGNILIRFDQQAFRVSVDNDYYVPGKTPVWWSCATTNNMCF